MSQLIRVNQQEVLQDTSASTFILPETKNATRAFLRLHTELKLNQVFELIDKVTFELENVSREYDAREYTGVQLNIILLLTGAQVKQDKADDSFYIPLIVLPKDHIIRIKWQSKVLNEKEDLRRKLHIGKAPSLLLLSGATTVPETFETNNWIVSPPIEIAIKEDENNEFAVELKGFPICQSVGQVVFYGHSTAQTWLKQGELFLKKQFSTDKSVACFKEPYESMVFDKILWDLPVPATAIYTFTFAALTLTDKGGEVFDSAPVLRLKLEPQHMPKNPVLQLWVIYQR